MLSAPGNLVSFLPARKPPEGDEGWTSRSSSTLQRCQKDATTQSAIARPFHGMIGDSKVMKALFRRIVQVAPYFRSVLIMGATGTGKEHIARALHHLGPAATGRLVVVNCTAIVETLFESELFGHVRGSFTGASRDKMGLFEFAHKGTLFLDEIGDMPMGTQAKLLRALQCQEVHRLGSLSPRKVDVRVIAATNRDLREAIEKRQFREDLYYRLAMVEIGTPTLVERLDDLPLLLSHFLQTFSDTYRKEISHITSLAETILLQHDWPGNVRELENVIGHACMLTRSDTIDVEHLPVYLTVPRARTLTTAATASSFSMNLMSQERLLIENALERTCGNQTRAACLLGVSRDRLRYRMKKFGLADRKWVQGVA